MFEKWDGFGFWKPQNSFEGPSHIDMWFRLDFTSQLRSLCVRPPHLRKPQLKIITWMKNHAQAPIIKSYSWNLIQSTCKCS